MKQLCFAKPRFLVGVVMGFQGFSYIMLTPSRSLGVLLPTEVGFSAWLWSFSDWTALSLTSLAWAAIVPYALRDEGRPPRPEKLVETKADEVDLKVPEVLMVSLLGFLVCLAPPADVFLCFGSLEVENGRRVLGKFLGSWLDFMQV